MDTKTMNRLGNYMYAPQSSPNITAAKLIIHNLTEVHNILLAINNPEKQMEYMIPSHIIPIEITQSIPEGELYEIKRIAGECLSLLQIGSYGTNALCHMMNRCDYFAQIHKGYKL